MRVLWTARSCSRKLGPMPCCVVSDSTCPPSCPLLGDGCYANSGPVGIHWRRTDAEGLTWEAFCAKVQALPAGTLWRYGVAGDLPGAGVDIDHRPMVMLKYANFGKTAIAYTHKPMNSASNREQIRRAAYFGLIVNISTHTPREADWAMALGIAPVVCLVPRETPQVSRTPWGAKVVVCPAQTRGVTCQDCKLCARPERDFVIGFLPHGSGRSGGGKKVDAFVRKEMA